MGKIKKKEKKIGALGFLMGVTTDNLIQMKQHLVGCKQDRSWNWETINLDNI